MNMLLSHIMSVLCGAPPNRCHSRTVDLLENP